jgi:hypothetical protein
MVKFDDREEIVSEMMDSLAEQRKKRRRRRFSELKHPFQCHFPLCTKKYTSKGALNLHIKLKHRVNYVGSPLFPSWIAGKKSPFSVQPLCDTIAQILEQKNKGGFPLLPLPPQLQQLNYNRPFLNNATTPNRLVQLSVSPSFGKAPPSSPASSNNSTPPSSPNCSSSPPSSPGSPYVASEQNSDSSPPGSPCEKDTQSEQLAVSPVMLNTTFRPIAQSFSINSCFPRASVTSKGPIFPLQSQTSEIISSKILQSLAHGKELNFLNTTSPYQVLRKQVVPTCAPGMDEEDVALWLMDLKHAN